MSKESNLIINEVKKLLVSKEKQTIVVNSLKKVLNFENKFSKEMFLKNHSKKTQTQIELVYKERILHSKINSLSTLLGQNVVDKIAYGELGLLEYEFVYLVMPKIQKVLVLMNASSKEWKKVFLSLVDFVNENTQMIKTKTPKAIDGQVVDFVNKKTSDLFKTDSKKRIQQGYGYIKFLLDILKETSEYNQKAEKLLKIQIDKKVSQMFDKVRELNKVMYSKRSKEQILSKKIIERFSNILLKVLSSTKRESTNLLDNYFLDLGENISDSKPKRLKLVNYDTLSILLKDLLSSLDGNNYVFNSNGSNLVTAAVKEHYLNLEDNYDSYETVILYNLVIIFVVLKNLIG